MSILIEFFRKYSRSIKNLGYYFFASLAPLVISLICSPIFAMFLQPEDYAISGYYSSFTTLFSPLVLFYLNQYYLREYFYQDENGKQQLRALIFKAFVIFPFVIFALCLMGLLIYMKVFNPDSEIPFSPYAFLALFPLPLAGLYRLELIDCKVQRKGRDYFYISLINGIVVAAFSIVMVVVLKWGIIGRMLGVISFPLFFFCWSLIKHRDLLRISFDVKKLKDALVFCSPLVLASMLLFFSRGYDRVSLERTITVEELGLYSIGISIAGYLSVFSTAIGDTFTPDIFESLANKNYRRLLQYVGVQFLMLFIIVILFVLLIKPLIWLLTAGRYVEAAPFARIASLGTFTTLLYSITANIIQSFKNTTALLLGKIVGSVLCVVSYGALISNYGAYGAAWGTVLGNLYFSVFATLFFLIFFLRKKADNNS